MRRVTWFTLMALVAVSGCGKKAAKPREAAVDSFVATAPTNANVVPTAPTRGGEEASGSKIVGTKGNLSVKGGEGFGAPRAAAGRVLNQAELKDLHLGIFQSMQLDPGENPPGLEEVKQIVQQNSKMQKLVADEVVILTGSREKTGVFAYTQYPQRGGRHYVVTRSGVEEMEPAELKPRLEAQQSPIKMAK